jgi:hypothetical protein
MWLRPLGEVGVDHAIQGAAYSFISKGIRLSKWRATGSIL